MADRNRKKGSNKAGSKHDRGMSGSSSRHSEPLSGSSSRKGSMSGSGSDRSSSNIGSKQHRQFGSGERTSGSREESMQGQSREEQNLGGMQGRGSEEFGRGERIKGSARGGTQDIDRTGSARSATPGATGRGEFGEPLDENNIGSERRSGSGASSGTTPLGGERSRSSSAGGVEGVGDESGENLDEDLRRKR